MMNNYNVTNLQFMEICTAYCVGGYKFDNSDFIRITDDTAEDSTVTYVEVTKNAYDQIKSMIGQNVSKSIHICVMVKDANKTLMQATLQFNGMVKFSYSKYFAQFKLIDVAPVTATDKMKGIMSMEDTNSVTSLPRISIYGPTVKCHGTWIYALICDIDTCHAVSEEMVEQLFTADYWNHENDSYETVYCASVSGELPKAMKWKPMAKGDSLILKFARVNIVDWHLEVINAKFHSYACCEDGNATIISTDYITTEYRGDYLDDTMKDVRDTIKEFYEKRSQENAE